MKDGQKKDAKTYVGRSTNVHKLLFWAHTLCMNYVIKTFLLFSSSVSSKQHLCFVHCQGQESEQKRTTKYFIGFHNQSPLLTMVRSSHDLSNQLLCFVGDEWQRAEAKMTRTFLSSALLLILLTFSLLKSVYDTGIFTIYILILESPTAAVKWISVLPKDNVLSYSSWYCFVLAWESE